MLITVEGNPGVKDLLLKYPKCPYTALLVHNNSVFEFESHVSRLVHGTLAIHSKTLEFDLKQIIGSILPKEEDIVQDWKMLIIITHELDWVIHYDRFEPLDLSSCQLFCYGLPRSSPSIKNTQWVQDRQYIELQRPPGVTEILLCKDGDIYEGLVTNFFAIIEEGDGLCVITAPFHKTLAGTMANAVLNTCQQNRIKTKFECPNLNHHKWKACFLTNAYRCVQPVSKISQQDGTCRYFEDIDFVLILRSLVQQYLKANSTAL